MELSLELKKQVHQECLNTIADKIQILSTDLESLMQAKLNETKSSAGDKYETGMAMIQNQEAMLLSQKNMLLNQQQVLKKLKPEHQSTRVEHGALVKTNSAVVYYSIALGWMTVAGTKFFASSTDAPMYMALRNFTVGDQVKLNGNNILIEQIC